MENHYATQTATDIGVSSGRPASSVACIACKSGVTRRKAELWTEEEKAVIYVHYAAGMPMQDVMALLPGRTRGTILAKADKLGIKTPLTLESERVRYSERLLSVRRPKGRRTSAWQNGRCGKIKGL
ncbi:hypothetical protein [Lonsdalea quercina]|uniref:hypothetical protein n=2 Tax=Lonsdalea quercina TaxID=71657 RepID=UPI003975058F